MTIIVSSSGSGSTTALDIIKASLRLLQVASDDVTLTDSEAKDALETLNMMIEAWSNESLMLHHIVGESFTLVPTQSSYTMGVGGDFFTSRPNAIDKVTIKINGVEWPVKQLAFDDWAAIKLKTLTTTYAEYFYLDQTYPLSTLHVYPVPSAASTLTLYSRKPFTEFNNLTDSIEFPPGYKRAMKYQLAIELAPEYQTTAGEDIKTLAISSKANIKKVNYRPITKQVDAALSPSGRNRWNIYSGY